MTTHGFSNMYDPETDTEIEGPTRWGGTITGSFMHLQFAGRQVRRAFRLELMKTGTESTIALGYCALLVVAAVVWGGFKMNIYESTLLMIAINAVIYGLLCWDARRIGWLRSSDAEKSAYWSVRIDLEKARMKLRED